MDFKRFFKLLKRYAWVLISVPVVASLLTYYLVQDLPKQYKSNALISTGLADQSQRIQLEEKQMDYFALNQQFNSIIEFLMMKKSISSLSYKLILHDFENPEIAFSRWPESFRELDSISRREVIDSYKSFLSQGKIITPEDNHKYPLFDFLEHMQYNDLALLKRLEITRKEYSDFINIEFTSENPHLSVFVVNTIANDFVDSYAERANFNQKSSKQLLDSLLQGKEESMNAKNAQVKDFQVKNQVINLESQAEGLSLQIAEKEALRAATVGEIQSLTGAITGIEAKLKNKNSDLVSVNIAENNQIINLKTQLQKANERYVDNNFKPEDGRIIDSLQSALAGLIASTSSNGLGSNPRELRQSLIQQKIRMEVDLDRAKSGLSVILKDLSRLKGQYNNMVPNDAGMKNFEREAEVATKEYLNTLEVYNKNNMLSNAGILPELAQAGVVNPAEPSKQFIYVGMSGFGTFSVCILFLASAFMLDRRVNDSEQLSQITKHNVIGVVNKIIPNNTDLKTIWENSKTTIDYAVYKDLLRSLRFEIDGVLKGENKKVIGITSLYDNAGSSFIASSLAYSFAVTKKRVLLIGGEYALDKKSERKEIASNQFFDSFIVKREIQTEEFITKLVTNSKSESLLEIYDEHILRNGFDELKRDFDVIIIDAESLQKLHRAKEWLMFADKSFAIYPAGEVVGDYEKELITFMNGQEGFLGWVLNKVNVSEIGLRRLVHSN
jgi:succinoglycan biosynthesis transport protein ExoP